MATKSTTATPATNPSPAVTKASTPTTAIPGKAPAAPTSATAKATAAPAATTRPATASSAAVATASRPATATTTAKTTAVATAAKTTAVATAAKTTAVATAAKTTAVATAAKTTAVATAAKTTAVATAAKTTAVATAAKTTAVATAAKTTAVATAAKTTAVATAAKTTAVATAAKTTAVATAAKTTAVATAAKTTAVATAAKTTAVATAAKTTAVATAAKTTAVATAAKTTAVATAAKTTAVATAAKTTAVATAAKTTAVATAAKTTAAATTAKTTAATTSTTTTSAEKEKEVKNRLSNHFRDIKCPKDHSMTLSCGANDIGYVCVACHSGFLSGAPRYTCACNQPLCPHCATRFGRTGTQQLSPAKPKDLNASLTATTPTATRTATATTTQLLSPTKEQLSAITPVCPAGHPMRDSHEGRYPWKCQGKDCQVSGVPPHDSRFNCYWCIYDLCYGCAQKQSVQRSPVDLHLNRVSVNCFGVWLLLEEGKIDYRLVDVNLHEGGTRTKEFLAMNPNHKVPTIMYKGKSFWESNAILRYLVAAFKLPDRFYPKDACTRAQIDMALDWRQTTFYPHISQTCYPTLGFGGDPALVEAGKQALKRDFDFFATNFISAGGFIAGAEHPSIADFAVATVFKFLELTPDVRLPAAVQNYLHLFHRTVPRLAEISARHGANAMSLDQYLVYRRNVLAHPPAVTAAATATTTRPQTAGAAASAAISRNLNTTTMTSTFRDYVIASTTSTATTSSRPLTAPGGTSAASSSTTQPRVIDTRPVDRR